MRFTKKTGDGSTIRKVWNDEKTICLGIVGTVGDLLEAKVFDYCGYSPETWAYLPNDYTIKAWFGATREEALANIA